MGREFCFYQENVTKWAEDAGFRSVVGRTFKLPYGPWPKDRRLKELGTYVGHFLEMGLSGFVVYPIGEVLGWSKDEVDVLVAKIRRAFKDPKNLCNSDM